MLDWVKVILRLLGIIPKPGPPKPTGLYKLTTERAKMDAMRRKAEELLKRNCGN